MQSYDRLMSTPVVPRPAQFSSEEARGHHSTSAGNYVLVGEDELMFDNVVAGQCVVRSISHDRHTARRVRHDYEHLRDVEVDFLVR